MTRRRTPRQRELNRREEEPLRSPLYGSPRLKEVIIGVALAGFMTPEEVDEVFEEYGLKGA